MAIKTIIGKVGMTPEGAWSASRTDYVRLDIVTYNNGSYMVKFKDGFVPAGISPTNTTYFQPLVLPVQGEAGINWTPKFAIITDGIREVRQLVDYEGGTGVKPTINIGSYESVTGFTTNIANAKNIKGSQGLAGVSRIPAWTAAIYAANSSVLHLGKYWTSNAATVAGDIPGTSAKWVEDLTGYNVGGHIKTITVDDITNWNNAYKVYGVEWDTAVASTSMKRIGNLSLHASLPVQSLMKRCLLKDDGTVNYYLDANNSALKADGTPANLTGADGMVMVEIPEHYRKHESVGNIRRTLMSLNYVAGFTKIQKAYVSAYEATVDRAASKLASVVNLTANFRGGNDNAALDGQNNTFLGRPVSAVNRTNFRSYARNRGSIKWNLMLQEVRKTIFWLYQVEYANKNCQTPIDNTLTPEGYKRGGLGDGATGVIGSSPEWTAYNGLYPFIPCGISNSLGNNTGEVDYTPIGWPVAKTFKVSSYRGIENVFGHLNELIDGINIRMQANGAGGLSEVYIAKSLTFSDVGYDNYNKVGLMARSGGYVREILFGESGEIVPAISVGASSSTYWSDMFESALPAAGEEMRVVFSGGHSTNSSAAGLAYTYTHFGIAGALTTLGTRLCFLPEGIA